MALFRVHIPILDEVKSKGLKPALRDKADDLITRVTAGLDIADVRGVLRDDPPGRPNPRLKPHAEGFWLHMKPTYYHNLVDGLYPTFRLGWLSVYAFAFEIITGVFLMIYYTPSPLIAYENMLDILSNVPFGRLMRDMHKLGAEVMVIVVALHMLRTFITGSYKFPRQFTWATGVILLGVTLFLSFSGYLLPWDQLSLWAVTIGGSMAEAAPPEVGWYPGIGSELLQGHHPRAQPATRSGERRRRHGPQGPDGYADLLHADYPDARAVVRLGADLPARGLLGLHLPCSARAARRPARDPAPHNLSLVLPVAARDEGRVGH